MRKVLIVLPLLFLPFCLSAREQFTIGEYCRLLRLQAQTYPTDSPGHASLSEEHKVLCFTSSGAPLSPEHLVQSLPSSHKENAYLGGGTKAPPTADESERETNRIANENAANIAGLYQQCANRAAELYSACLTRTSQLQGEGGQLLGSIMSQMQGQTVETACRRIPSHAAKMNDLIQAANSDCSAYQSQCQKVCEQADYAMVEMRDQKPAMTPAMTSNRKDGNRSCARIETVVAEMRRQANNDQNSLNDRCVAARNEAEKQKGQPKPAGEKGLAVADDGSKASNSGVDWNGLGAAAANALGQLATSPNLPMPAQTGNLELGYGDVATGQNYSTDRARPTVRPGAVLPGLSPTSANPGGDMMLGGPDLPEGYQKTTLEDVPQNRGASTALGSAAGAGPAAGAKSGSKRAKGLPTEVYSGYQWGGGVSRSRYQPGRYGVEKADQGRMRRPAPAGVASGFYARVGDYLPGGRPLRGTAGNSTGPDGITGPHTNIFQKVRERYDQVPGLWQARLTP